MTPGADARHSGGRVHGPSPTVAGVVLHSMRAPLPGGDSIPLVSNPQDSRLNRAGTRQFALKRAFSRVIFFGRSTFKGRICPANPVALRKACLPQRTRHTGRLTMPSRTLSPVPARPGSESQILTRLFQARSEWDRLLQLSNLLKEAHIDLPD